MKQINRNKKIIEITLPFIIMRNPDVRINCSYTESADVKVTVKIFPSY